jgi:hypothetical protein
MTSSNFSFQQELAITEKIPHLSILLKKYYSEKRYILLITLAPVINLSSEYVHELLKKSCADEKIDAYDPDIFSNLIFEKAKNDLAFNDFSFSDLNELAEVERKMMLEFLKARLQGIIDNALNFSKIIESIFKYYPILKSKRL